MANEKHLAKLKEGVEAWNQWRKENPKIKPDLSTANLSLAYLYRANFNGVDLSNANLSGTKLADANLSNANLYNANFNGADLSSAKLAIHLGYELLSNANLSNANLYNANFNEADLSYVKLDNMDLEEANFEGANLKGANFKCSNLNDSKLSSANLENANLESANLKGANLKSVNLIGANLTGAHLNDVNLIDANLTDANFTGAKLSSAELSSVNLNGAILIRVQALKTNFEGATLTGACIEDWNINSQTNLQKVKCDYIYLREIYSEEEKKWKFADRVPHDPDKIFAPGEFTKRYQKILETVNLYFGEGIDWQVFLNSFQKLQEEERIKIADGEREIPIVQGIENTGDGSFVIKVGVSPDTDKGEWEKSFWQKYQPMLEAKEEQINFFREELTIKRQELQDKHQENTKLMGIIETMAEKESSKFNFINPSITGGVADKFEGIHMGGDIHNYAPEQKQSLAEAAAEIQQLLDQLSQEYPTETFAEKGAVADKTIQEIKDNPTRWQKVIKVIQAMGIEALAEAVDNPIFNIAKAGIEAALESES